MTVLHQHCVTAPVLVANAFGGIADNGEPKTRIGIAMMKFVNLIETPHF